MKQLFDRVERAKQNRNGGPREDRPAAVDSVLSETHTVGFRDGESISEVGYDAYPNDRETILRPQSGEVLNDIADAVESMEQLSDELGISDGSLLEKATQLHGIELPDSVEPSPIVEVPDVEGGSLNINTNDFEQFTNLFHLYVTLGMGADEIGTLVNEDEQTVRRALSDKNLL